MADEGRLARCLSCLGSVPCATLSAWILLVVSVSACCASSMVAVQRTRLLLDQPDLFPVAHWVILGVILGLLVLGTVFLVVAIATSLPNSVCLFTSEKRRKCGRVCNILILLFMLLIQFAAILLSTLLAVPNMLFLLLLYLRKVLQLDCLDLQQFLVSSSSKIFCGDQLDLLLQKSQETFICYAIAYISSVLIAFSMSLYALFCITNFVLLGADHASYEACAATERKIFIESKA